MRHPSRARSCRWPRYGTKPPSTMQELRPCRFEMDEMTEQVTSGHNMTTPTESLPSVRRKAAPGEIGDSGPVQSLPTDVHRLPWRGRRDIVIGACAFALWAAVMSLQPSAQSQEAQAYTIAIVKSDSAPILATPDPSRPPTNVGVKGASFRTLGVDGDWVRIEVDGRLRYVATAHVDLVTRSGPSGTSNAECSDSPTGVSYVFPAPTPLLATPLPGSPRIVTAQTNAIGIVTCSTTGYLRVTLVGNDATKAGWFSATKEQVSENLLAEGVSGPVLREVQMAGKAWPQAVTSAILRKRVRIGFTSEQVTIALGKPRRVTSEETAARVTEVWLYPDQSITFTAKRVSAIRRSQ